MNNIEVKSESLQASELEQIKVKSDRQTGFEILRILAMILICAVHIMNAGGMLKNSGEGVALLTQRLLYSIFTTSVNIFVLISGYFMVKSKFKPKKIFQLWLEVLFYSILTYLIFCIFANGNFSIKEFFTTFLPIIYQKYWFFSAYFLLYLISPFLNKILNYSSKKELTFLIVGLFLLVYFVSCFKIKDVASFAYGYSIIWFIILYLFGGYFRLYPPKIKKFWIFLIYLCCTLTLWGMCYMPVDNFVAALIYNPLEYTSPLVFIASVCVLLLFKNIKIKNKFIHNSICFVSSCTFGVYLFHCSYIWEYIVFDILKIQKFYGSPYSALLVIAFALAIFAIGLVVDCVRKFLVWMIKLINKSIQERKIKGKSI